MSMHNSEGSCPHGGSPVVYSAPALEDRGGSGPPPDGSRWPGASAWRGKAVVPSWTLEVPGAGPSGRWWLTFIIVMFELLSSLLWTWLPRACGGAPERGNVACVLGWHPGPRSAREAGGQSRAQRVWAGGGPQHLSGVAGPPAPICRGAAHPPRVGWETSELRSTFSKHLVHSRWRPQLPFSLQFRLHFPSLRSPLLFNFGFCIWRWGGSLQASKPPVTGEAWCSVCGQFAKKKRPQAPAALSWKLSPAHVPHPFESLRPDGPAL